jgi:hypothetical protein
LFTGAEYLAGFAWMPVVVSAVGELDESRTDMRGSEKTPAAKALGFSSCKEIDRSVAAFFRQL